MKKKIDAEKILKAEMEERKVELKGAYRGWKKPHLFSCQTCGWEWETNPYALTKAKGTGCKKCSDMAQRKPNTLLLTWEEFVKLDISSPAHPGAVMLINRKKWEIYTREGIGRVGVGAKGYPVAKWQGKRVFIHRLVMGFPKEVDHVNGIKWDNRTCNLREATALQNQMNRGLRKTNKSGVIGVHEKKPGVWEACLKVGRKRVHQSSHKSLEAAAAARTEAVRQHCGEFAPVVL